MQAFCGLSLQEVAAIFVRQQLLRWSPLDDDGSFVNMEWFATLNDWETDTPNGTKATVGDDDRHLLVNLVEQHAVPRIRLDVLYRWNPLSRQQSAKLLAIASDIHTRWPDRPALLEGMLLPVKRGITGVMSEMQLSTFSQATTEAAKSQSIAQYHDIIKVPCVAMSVRSLSCWHSHSSLGWPPLDDPHLTALDAIRRL